MTNSCHGWLMCLMSEFSVFVYSFLGSGFKYVLFSSLFGEMIQVDQYFSNG